MCLYICFLWTGQYSTPSRPVKHKLLLIWFLSQLSICCNEIIHALSLGWSQWGDRPIIDRYAFHIQMSLMCAGEQELGCSCSVPFHSYGLLFILSVEAVREQCVFYGCERFQSDGSSLRSSGACWSSFKRVALYHHSESTQMAPWSVRGFSDGKLRCRHICWKAFFFFKWIIHWVCRGIGCVQGGILKPDE